MSHEYLGDRENSGDSIERIGGNLNKFQKEDD
jgi:hypothetical protein